MVQCLVKHRDNLTLTFLPFLGPPVLCLLSVQTGKMFHRIRSRLLFPVRVKLFLRLIK
jgi:hypothetical protein